MILYTFQIDRGQYLLFAELKNQLNTELVKCEVARNLKVNCFLCAELMCHLSVTVIVPTDLVTGLRWLPTIKNMKNVLNHNFLETQI